jgi:hypothetical protein
MSHLSASVPSRDQRVGQASVPRDGLFSHPSTAQALEQCRPPVGECVDWRTMPFSAGHRRTVTVDGQPIQADQRLPAVCLDQRHPRRR